jgi:hypothetical protein
MTYSHKGTSGNTRRVVLQSVVGVAVSASALILGVSASKAAKVSQAAVGYRGSPNGSASCENCGLFEPPNSCKVVDGTISPSGWCRIWSKKAG